MFQKLTKPDKQCDKRKCDCTDGSMRKSIRSLAVLLLVFREVWILALVADPKSMEKLQANSWGRPQEVLRWSGYLQSG